MKFTGLGAKFTDAVTPEPDSATDCLDPVTAPESSVITSVTGPNELTAVGAKVTLIVQVPFAGIARPLVHVDVPAIPNSVEFVPTVIATAPVDARFRVSVPLFVSTRAMVEVWLIGWLPNGSVAATCAVGAMPVPDRATVCFVPAVPVAFPLSVMSTVAVRALAAVGLNATLNVQEAWPETLPPVSGHGFVAPAESTKSPGLPLASRTMLAMAKEASPVLEIVTVVVALVVPTRWFANGTLVAESVAVGGAWPVPVRLTDCTLPVVPFELSVNFRAADLAPTAPGVKVRATVQVLLPAAELMTAPATHAPAPPGTIAKSDGLVLVGSITTVAMVRLAEPELVRVTVCEALLTLTSSLPKPSVVGGFSETTGAVPVPVRGRSCGLPLALSVTFTVAVRFPDADGVNVAAIVQVAPAANVVVVRQSVSPEPVGVTSRKSPGLPVVLSIATLVIVSCPVPEFVKVEVD